MFLTDEWVKALDDAARSHRADEVMAPSEALVVQQTVTDMADGGSFTYHVIFDDDGVRFTSGPAPEATISFSQDLNTAVGIARGADSAQAAFMSGRMQVGGDLTVLTGNGTAFADLTDVFTAVREQTDLPDLPNPSGDA